MQATTVTAAPSHAHTLWTQEEDLFIVSHLCFLPATEWAAILVEYTEKARESPKAFPKVRLSLTFHRILTPA